MVFVFGTIPCPFVGPMACHACRRSRADCFAMLKVVLAGGEIVRQSDIQRDKQSGRATERHRKTDRSTNRQKHRQTDR